MYFFTDFIFCFINDRERLGEKCMDFEMEGVRAWDRPKKTWTEVIEKDCQTQQLCNEDAVDRRKWRKLIKDVV